MSTPTTTLRPVAAERRPPSGNPKNARPRLATSIHRPSSSTGPVVATTIGVACPDADAMPARLVEACVDQADHATDDGVRAVERAGRSLETPNHGVASDDRAARSSCRRCRWPRPVDAVFALE